MEGRAERSVVFSHMAVLAALSVVVLIGVSVWQAHKVIVGGNPVNAANNPKELPEYAQSPWEEVDWQAPVNGEASPDDPDGLSNIGDNVAYALLGSYNALTNTGLYTQGNATQIAEDIAATLEANVSYKTYTAGEITTDSDTSYERMLAYRNDLRIALEPLLQNPGYELGLFANYIDSHDPRYGEDLRKTAENYRKATENTAKVVVPADALERHVAILNALSEFGATVDAMTKHAEDAFATAALLSTYNTSEQNLLLAFDGLVSYQKSKQL